ncbi:MAG: ATP-binding cassette domain-containing protein, partial [Lapillicoccus sp.]
VTIDGLAPQEVPGRVGLVLQDPGAGVVAASLGRDVAFGLENLAIPPAEMMAPVARALADVRLDIDPAAPPSTLSGGEQQRLALAGALAMAPGVLLLDEPLAMLDAATGQTVRAVVSEVVAARGLTVVVVEHRLGPWLDHVDRLVVLGPAGAVIADGVPGQILARHGDALAAQGIWVPGRADPDPLDIAIPWARPRVVLGEVTAAAHAVTVRHTSRGLTGPPRTTTAVRDADLELRAGHLTALVGPSGAGKSSLMSVVGGLLAPTEGRVEWPGLRAEGGQPPPAPHELSPVELAREVAWVPQRVASTILRRTVREEVLATAVAIELDAHVAYARADVLLDRLGLTPLSGVDPRQLSGGEQRRLAVASAVLHQPGLVLADEPTVGQDRLTWAAVVGVLESIRGAGSAVLVTTHDGGVISRADAVHHLQPQTDTGPTTAETRRSLAARCGPLSLLVAALLVLPLPALLESWRQALAVIAAEVALGAVALATPGQGRRPTGRLSRLARRLIAPGFAVAGVAWSTWLLGGHDLEVAAGAGLRVLALVLPSVVVLPFVNPDALGDHLGQRLHLPARPVVAFTAALQRFQAFGDLWRELALARRVRGVGGGRSLASRAREVAETAFGLFVGVLGQAATLALAMDARGFAGARRRTWAGAAGWGVADTVAVLLGVIPVVVAAALRPLL